MINILLPYYKKYKEIILYLIFGFLTTVVNYVSYFALTRVFGIGLVPSNIIAWLFAVMFAYITNRKWVFESKTRGAKVLLEIGSFVAARIFSGVVDTVAMVVLVERLSVNDLIAKVLVSVLVIILNYILSKLVIFKKKQ